MEFKFCFRMFNKYFLTAIDIMIMICDLLCNGATTRLISSVSESGEALRCRLRFCFEEELDLLDLLDLDFLVDTEVVDTSLSLLLDLDLRRLDFSVKDDLDLTRLEPLSSFGEILPTLAKY